MVDSLAQPSGPVCVPVLSRFTAQELLDARARDEASPLCSLDLGITRTLVKLEPRGVVLPDGTFMNWEAIAEIRESELTCFLVINGGIEPIRTYSEATQRTAQLMPTAGPPALLLSGFVMHRVRDVSPLEGAKRMVEALRPVGGALLDMATGLGYAAIEAARHVDRVTTIELDPAAEWVAARNPWSRKLFTDPKIHRRRGDSSELIRSFEAASFSSILHDPPAINLAGELYSAFLYSEMHRVLAPRGRLFHYVGDPQSASGRKVTRGVVDRLRRAGFAKVTATPEAFGVLAFR